MSDEPRLNRAEERAWRLGVLVSHPVQYYAAWFRHLARRVDLEVFYAHRQDAAGQAAAGFGVAFEWDVPLLEGYSHRFLRNRARRPSVATFRGCDTPEIDPLIAAGGFDAFLVFGWNRKSSLQAIRACRRHRVPLFMRGDSQLVTPRSALKRAAKYVPYRLLLPALDAHLYVGRRNRDYLRHYGVPEDRLFFVPHAVDNDFFAAAAEQAERRGATHRLRVELGIPAGAFVFLFAGKMIEVKRPDDFVRAFLQLGAADDGRAAHAVLAGDGPLRPALEARAKGAVARVHFLGFRNQGEMPAVHRMADALVLPGRETWGLVVNEAAACGTPAIVSDAAGCGPDLVDEGRTGFTYPAADVAALAARMRAMIELEARSREDVRRSLRQTMAAYSFDAATEGVAQALRARARRDGAPRRATIGATRPEPGGRSAAAGADLPGEPR